MRLMLILFFPLLGLFDYLRMQDLRILGYLIFVLPIYTSIVYVIIIKPTFNGQRSNPLRYLKLRRGVRSYHAVLLTAFFLIILIGFLRAIYVGAREKDVGIAEFTIFTSLVLFFYAVIVDALNEGWYDSLLNNVGTSLFLLMLANVVGMAIGITSPGIDGNYSRLLENPYWFTGYRVIFPFMTSGQMLSIQAGLLVIFGIFRSMATGNKNSILIGSVMVAVGMVIMLGHGGRAAMMVLIGVLAFVALWKLSRPTLLLILTIFLFFPILVIWGDIGNSLLDLTENLGVPISRIEGDVSSFSNRDKIFAIIILGYVTQTDVLTLLFGYGAYGQVTSALSYQYSMLFEHSYLNPFEMPAHNTILQILMDYGLIGMGLFMLLVFNLARSIKKNMLYRKKCGQLDKNEKLLVALLLYLIGSSMTEASITYYAFGVLSVFIVLNMLVIFDRLSVQSKMNIFKYQVKLT